MESKKIYVRGLGDNEPIINGEVVAKNPNGTTAAWMHTINSDNETEHISGAVVDPDGKAAPKERADKKYGGMHSAETQSLYNVLSWQCDKTCQIVKFLDDPDIDVHTRALAIAAGYSDYPANLAVHAFEALYLRRAKVIMLVNENDWDEGESLSQREERNLMAGMLLSGGNRDVTEFWHHYNEWLEVDIKVLYWALVHEEKDIADAAAKAALHIMRKA